MPKLIRYLFALFIAAMPAFSQATSGPYIRPWNVVATTAALPTTGCVAGSGVYFVLAASPGAQIYTNSTTGTCTWTANGGGGGGGAVNSVFGRTGVVTAHTGDYTASQVTNSVDSTGSYSNPSFITSLAGSKVTGLGGSCTNQVATAIGFSAVPTCTTVSSAYTDNSIAKTGVDITTSNQVTATHLAAPLPVLQGGTGTATPNLTGSGGCTVTGTWPNQTVSCSGAGLPTGAAGVPYYNGSGGWTNSQFPVMGSSSYIQLAGFNTGGGTAQAQTMTLSVCPTTLTGTVQWFPSNSNTGPGATLNVCGLGAKPVTKYGVNPIAAGDISSTALAVAIYDGSNWELQNPQTSPSSITFQTNGTANISQNVLNLQAGSGVSLSNASGGTVNISASGGSLNPLTPATTGAGTVAVSGTGVTGTGSNFTALFPGCTSTAHSCPSNSGIAVTPPSYASHSGYITTSASTLSDDATYGGIDPGSIIWGVDGTTLPVSAGDRITPTRKYTVDSGNTPEFWTIAKVLTSNISTSLIPVYPGVGSGFAYPLLTCGGNALPNQCYITVPTAPSAGGDLATIVLTNGSSANGTYTVPTGGWSTNNAPYNNYSGSITVNNPNSLAPGIYAIEGLTANITAFGVTATTNASPDVLTSPGNNLINGQHVTISGCTGDTAPNGSQVVTNVGIAGQFQLIGVNGNGAYTGGCKIAITAIPIGTTPNVSISVAAGSGSCTPQCATATFVRPHGLSLGDVFHVSGYTGGSSGINVASATVLSTNTNDWPTVLTFATSASIGTYAQQSGTISVPYTAVPHAIYSSVDSVTSNTSLTLAIPAPPIAAGASWASAPGNNAAFITAAAAGSFSTASTGANQDYYFQNTSTIWQVNNSTLASIVVGSCAGPNCTAVATVSGVPASGSGIQVSVAGCSTTALNGMWGNLTVIDATHFSFATTGVSAGTYNNSGMTIGPADGAVYVGNYVGQITSNAGSRFILTDPHHTGFAFWGGSNYTLDGWTINSLYQTIPNTVAALGGEYQSGIFSKYSDHPTYRNMSTYMGMGNFLDIENAAGPALRGTRAHNLAGGGCLVSANNSAARIEDSTCINTNDYFSVFGQNNAFPLVDQNMRNTTVTGTVLVNNKQMRIASPDIVITGVAMEGCQENCIGISTASGDIGDVSVVNAQLNNGFALGSAGQPGAIPAIISINGPNTNVYFSDVHIRGGFGNGIDVRSDTGNGKVHVSNSIIDGVGECGINFTASAGLVLNGNTYNKTGGMAVCSSGNNTSSHQSANETVNDANQTLSSIPVVNTGGVAYAMFNNNSDALTNLTINDSRSTALAYNLFEGFCNTYARIDVLSGNVVDGSHPLNFLGGQAGISYVRGTPQQFAISAASSIFPITETFSVSGSTPITTIGVPKGMQYGDKWTLIPNGTVYFTSGGNLISPPSSITTPASLELTSAGLVFIGGGSGGALPGTVNQLLTSNGGGGASASTCTSSSGSISCPGSGGVSGEIDLFDTGGTNYFSWRAPSSLAGIINYVIPSAAPTVGQVMAFGAPSGGVSSGSWITPGGSVSPGADGQVYSSDSTQGSNPLFENSPYSPLPIPAVVATWTPYGTVNGTIAKSQVGSRILFTFSGANTPEVHGITVPVSSASDFAKVIGTVVMDDWHNAASVDYGAFATDGTKYESCSLQVSGGGYTGFTANKGATSNGTPTSISGIPSISFGLGYSSPRYWKLGWTQSSHTLTCSFSPDGFVWLTVWTDSAPFLTPTAVGVLKNQNYTASYLDNTIIFGYR